MTGERADQPVALDPVKGANDLKVETWSEHVRQPVAWTPQITASECGKSHHLGVKSGRMMANSQTNYFWESPRPSSWVSSCYAQMNPVERERETWIIRCFNSCLNL